MRIERMAGLLFVAGCAAEAVLPPPPPPPAAPTYQLKLSPTGITLGIGANVRVTAQLVPSFGATINPTAPVTYLARTPSRLTVTATGIAEGVAVGPATIVASTVHMGTLLVDSLVYTVNQTCVGLIGVVVTPVSSVLTVGQHLLPTAQPIGSPCFNQPAEVFTWSAVDSTVVSVDSVTGETIGLKPGITLVRARGVSSHIAGSITVTVQ